MGIDFGKVEKKNASGEEGVNIMNLDDRPGSLITIDFSIEKPIYLQIMDNIISLIASGELKSGTKLPSSRKLSGLLGVNYHTVNKSYEVLINKGILVMDRRKKVEIRNITPEQLLKPDASWISREKVLLEEAISTGILKDTLLTTISDLLDSMRGRSGGI